jgi:hypothetical protein
MRTPADTIARAGRCSRPGSPKVNGIKANLRPNAPSNLWQRCADWGIRFKTTRATVPGLAGIHLIPGTGHFVQLEAAEAVNKLMVDFLSVVVR